MNGKKNQDIYLHILECRSFTDTPKKIKINIKKVNESLRVDVLAIVYRENI